MAAKPVMVLSSDWHLAPLSWKKHPRITKDAYHSLSQIVDLAINLNVPLIGAGDLFDVKTPPAESVIHCHNEMEALAKAGLNMYYVQGQHEMSDPPWLTLCKNAIHIDSFVDNPETPKIFDINGISVCGMDICQSPLNFSLLLNRLIDAAPKDKFDLYVTHQVWGDFIKKGDEPYLLKNANFAKVVYTGDFHKDLILNVNNTVCISSGSINMQANNEPPVKRVFVLNDDLSVTDHYLKTRPFVCLEIKTEDHFKFVMDTDKEALISDWDFNGIPEEIRTPLIVIKYQNTITNAFFSLKDKFKDWNHEINPTDFSSVEMTASVERREIRELVDIGDCVAKCGVSPDCVTYADALRIFNSSDVESELKIMRSEHLEKGADNVS